MPELRMSSSSDSTSSNFFSETNLNQPRQSRSSPPSTPPTSESVAPQAGGSPMKDFVLDTKTNIDALSIDEGDSGVIMQTLQSIGSGRSGRHKLKRTHLQYTLHQGEPEVGLPSKRARPLKTTWSDPCAPGSDTLNYLNERMLELSHITRRALATRLRYQCLRAHELDLMKSIHEDETELTQTDLKDVDLQIGSIRNLLHNGGGWWL
ncbi:hypothetical protein EV702DRAFT_1200387 [Suillus placidus]|uniref:Uncharacterized protein n=1 Tax=Suillus placidus TaxID=48579 RepID=A0A9P7CZX1_9AGAM|nr:hypothetical protein EV702DRAFT_1200387 [Suillus placidus]